MKISFHPVSFLIVGGLTVLPLSIHAQTPVQLSAKIVGFDLATCGLKNCLRIESDLALVGMYGGNYAFESARIAIIDKKTGRATALQSLDTYLDIISDKLFMRNLTTYHGFDGIYDLEKEELVLIPSEKI